MNTEVVIVGGGMVGAALALALARHDMAVTLVERQAPSVGDELEPRVSAISEGALRFLQRLDVSLPSEHCQPYRHLWVGEADSHCQFSASELGEPRLGLFVENVRLQQALWQAMPDSVALHLGTPVQFRQQANGVELTMDNGEVIAARLAIAADGANSWLRQQAGIGLTGWDYRQHCLLATVETQGQMADTTWQQFTPHGPRAWLPMPHNQAILAWYDEAATIRQLASLSAEALTVQAKLAYPAMLGDITAKRWGSFALTRRHAQHYGQNGVWLVGDAAHTINPLAGQGVNLGFRDVQTLAAQMGGAHARGECWWDDKALQRYERARKPDNLLMQSMMDLCYKGFSNTNPLLGRLRQLALSSVDLFSPAKKQILKYAAGL